MPQVAESISGLLEELNQRLRDLEQRVSALEDRPAIPLKDTQSRTSSAMGQQPPEPLLAGLNSGIFPTLGKAVLGFAGAFLLRAISESSSTANFPVLAVAILYAFLWMIWAIQPNWWPQRFRFLKLGIRDRFSSTTYALTSALILSPLLWESTVRFHVLSTTFASTILVAFVVMTLVLSRGHDLQLIPWIATTSTAATAVALIIATRDLVPLTSALLAISLVTEITIVSGHQLSFRALPAAVSDFAIWLVISILGSEPVPEGYRPAAESTIILLTIALPTIYVASIAMRGFVQRNRLTTFEIGQAALSFGLTTYGTLRVTQNSAATVLGAIFLVLSLICYWGTLSRFEAECYTRNRRVTAYAAAAFLLAGSFLLLPARWEEPFLCFAAIFATVFYRRTLKLSLGVHASLYLTAAVAISSLPGYIANATAGDARSSPPWPEMAVALTAALCYAIGSRTKSDVTPRRMLWIVPAFVATAGLSAVLITTIVRFTASPAGIAASHLSVIRTVVICTLALGLAVSSQSPHVELGWIAYSAVALGSLKLIFEDLRFGNPASLVLSFLFYGLVLILLPRLIRSRRAEDGQKNA